MPASSSASHRDSASSSPKEFSPHEVDGRRDAAVRRALSTPPKPKQKPVKRKDELKKEKPAN